MSNWGRHKQPDDTNNREGPDEGGGQIVVAGGERGKEGSTATNPGDHVTVSIPAEVFYNREASYEFLGEMQKGFDLMFAERVGAGINLEMDGMELGVVRGCMDKVHMIQEDVHPLPFTGEEGGMIMEVGEGREDGSQHADPLVGESSIGPSEFILRQREKSQELLRVKHLLVSVLCFVCWLERRGSCSLEKVGKWDVEEN